MSAWFSFTIISMLVLERTGCRPGGSTFCTSCSGGSQQGREAFSCIQMVMCVYHCHVVGGNRTAHIAMVKSNVAIF